jgi:hypothetical protein
MAALRRCGCRYPFDCPDCGDGNEQIERRTGVERRQEIDFDKALTRIQAMEDLKPGMPAGRIGDERLERSVEET